MNTESLTLDERTAVLARIAHTLTVCARTTYEAGTENVFEPQLLRSYNELLHRVTAAVQEHASGDAEFSLETIVEMIRQFGTRYGQTQLLDSAVNRAIEEFQRKL